METPKSNKKVAKKYESTTPVSSMRFNENDSNRNRVGTEWSTYGYDTEYSPTAFTCTQEVLEVGWGDSPVHKKPYKLQMTSTPNRLLERRRSSPTPNVISFFKLPIKPQLDTSQSLIIMERLSEVVKEEIKNRRNSTVKSKTEEERDVLCVTPTQRLDFSDENLESIRNKDRVQEPVNNIVSKLLKDDDSMNDCLLQCTQNVEELLKVSKIPDTTHFSTNHIISDSCNDTPGLPVKKSVTAKRGLYLRNSLLENPIHEVPTYEKSKITLFNKNDNSFEKVLQSFKAEDETDVWLSQAFIEGDKKPNRTPGKANFVKSRSENLLSSPAEGTKHEVQTNEHKMTILDKYNQIVSSKNVPNTFRRTNSFEASNSSPIRTGTKQVRNTTNTTVQPMKKQKSDLSDLPMRCTPEEIENKRLEALYRKERKEIERKKMEALKKRSITLQKKNASSS